VTVAHTAELRAAFETARDLLLERCVAQDGQPAHWSGELSTSALSTATAVMALHQVRQAGRCGTDFGLNADFGALIHGGLLWLVKHQNQDGGWGDTVKSLSNISTTMLAHAVFHATGATAEFAGVVERVEAYINRIGGVEAVRRRYGRDKTFSVPILTHCALAGLVDWREVSSLPFELACLPARFYAAVKLPVVSYALPALIAIGQVKFHHRPTRNPVTWLLRKLAINHSLKVLERIQPPNGGFLEATPLTSFVTMSLAGKGLVDHPVVRRGVKFLCESVRPDGSWPIDTNLATWVTTLSINALKDHLPDHLRPGLRQWLLRQQYREVHPYTNAPPGGWAWTDLPGGVPDADDTPGAMLALIELQRGNAESAEAAEKSGSSLRAGVNWLLGLQNRDWGFPTFCRGWGTLPFDRSSPDITAHCVRALRAVADVPERETDLNVRASRGATRLRSSVAPRLRLDQQPSIRTAFRFLQRRQRPDGAWLPLWFGCQHAPDDENPTYGTSRVLMAYRDCGMLDSEEARRGAAFLAEIQNPDGGWGGSQGVASTVEETALAAEVLLEFDEYRKNAWRGIDWLIDQVRAGSVAEPSPIGFYFAKLWYFERLYPLIFAVSALRRAVEISSEPGQASV